MKPHKKMLLATYGLAQKEAIVNMVIAHKVVLHIKVRLKKFFFLISLFLFLFSTYSYPCEYFYLDMNNVNSNSALIVKSSNLNKKLDYDKDLVFNTINNDIDDFVIKVLSGAFPISIDVGRINYNAMDIAVLNHASSSSKEKLKDYGIYLTNSGIKKILSSRFTHIDLKNIANYSLYPLDEVLVNVGTKKYSLVNFLILSKNYGAIDVISKITYFDINSNIAIGDMVDISALDIESRLTLSKHISVGQYIEEYEKYSSDFYMENQGKSSFSLEEYSFYILSELCHNTQDQVLINLPTNLDILRPIEENSVLPKSFDYSDLNKLEEYPFSQEYLLQYRLSHREESLKTIFIPIPPSEIEFSQFTQENTLYMLNLGVSLSEFKFLHGETSWDTVSEKFNIRRLAFYLIKNNSTSQILNFLKKHDFSNIFFKEKNIYFYLILYSTNSISIEAFLSLHPISNYGLNVAEILYLKQGFLDFSPKLVDYMNANNIRILP